MKQEASGFPAWCKTEEDRAKYIKSFHEREKITLEEGKIKSNPGMRQLAKLMLNSINSSNKRDVSFECLKAMVREEAPPLVVRYDKRIGHVVLRLYRNHRRKLFI
ncbi:hypothetical protein J437_LFUL009726 [Ladona fulva]|uniref:Uncharacterized protein n=1 Tax=Ladona fulva TaxID=123851 RepID=A0A8K0K7F7_LADFU|nr:hypothetical protein J437_LFUL009726 [Ladona fulva]